MSEATGAREVKSGRPLDKLGAMRRHGALGLIVDQPAQSQAVAMVVRRPRVRDIATRKSGRGMRRVAVTRIALHDWNKQGSRACCRIRAWLNRGSRSGAP